jgi:hypothetical protein
MGHQPTLARNARLAILVVASTVSAFGVPGCKSKASQEHTAYNSAYYRLHPDPNKPIPDALNLMSGDILLATNANDEAAAIRRLLQYMTDHQLSYKMTAVRIDLNRPVQTMSTQPYPIRVDCSIFQGQEPVYNFSFVPRDNRNMALFGE